MNNIISILNTAAEQFTGSQQNVENKLPPRNGIETTPRPAPNNSVIDCTNVNLQERASPHSNHSAPLQSLFEGWPPGKEWWKGIEYLDELVGSGHNLSDYIMQLEIKRGVILLWGGGEMRNVEDIAEQDPEYREYWCSLGTVHNITYREYSSHAGGLGSDGRLDITTAVVNELLELYISDIHKLHPFLDLREIQTMFEKFKEDNSPDTKPTHVARQPHSHIKRKRWNSSLSEDDSAKTPFGHSLSNAIVLLILALGKVCSYKDVHPLPNPESYRSARSNGTWGPLDSSSHASGSFECEMPTNCCPKNIGIMPGMAYYAFAMHILVKEQGGLTLAHAQAFILAALYLSQFARVLESWSWIDSACQIVVMLLKP